MAAALLDEDNGRRSSNECSTHCFRLRQGDRKCEGWGGCLSPPHLQQWQQQDTAGVPCTADGRDGEDKDTGQGPVLDPRWELHFVRR